MCSLGCLRNIQGCLQEITYLLGSVRGKGWWGWEVPEATVRAVCGFRRLGSLLNGTHEAHDLASLLEQYCSWLSDLASNG